MKFATMFLLLASAACAPKAVRVIAEKPTYVIGKTSANHYIINASSFQEAKTAADRELNCAKHICATKPGGIIVYIETFDKRDK